MTCSYNHKKTVLHFEKIIHAAWWWNTVLLAIRYYISRKSIYSKQRARVCRSKELATRQNTCRRTSVRGAWFMKFRVDVGPLGQLVRDRAVQGTDVCAQVTFSNKDEVIKLSPLRSHVVHNRLRGRKMLRWSVWPETEAQTICPVGPAKRILLQGHCKIVKSHILSLWLWGNLVNYLEI